jgi:hypothetical protein
MRLKKIVLLVEKEEIEEGMFLYCRCRNTNLIMSSFLTCIARKSGIVMRKFLRAPLSYCLNNVIYIF